MLVFKSSFLISGEIYVTEIEKKPVINKNYSEIATVVLNNCIEIRDIRIIKTEKKIKLIYPTYISKNEIEYSQIKLLTKQANDEIEKAVLFSTPSVSPIGKPVTYKISKFSRYKGDSALKVFASVDFNDAIRVECKIMQSYRRPWVSWPAYASTTELLADKKATMDEPADKVKNNEWVNQVIIINKKLKSDVEKALLERYKSMKSEMGDAE